MMKGLVPNILFGYAHWKLWEGGFWGGKCPPFTVNTTVKDKTLIYL